MSNAHDSHGPARYARHYVPEGPVRPVDHEVLRQVLTGGAVVVGVEVVTAILSLLGSLSWGFGPIAALQLGFELGRTLLFATAVALTSLYVLPLGRALGTATVLARLAVGGAVGTVFLIGATIAWTVLTMGALPGFAIIDSGITRPIAIGLVNTALFALGVLIIRSLPERPRDASSVAPLPPA